MAIRYPIAKHERLSTADDAVFERWCMLPANDLRTIEEFVEDDGQPLLTSRDGVMDRMRPWPRPLPPPPPPAKRFTIPELRALGMSTQQISERLHATFDTIHAELSRGATDSTGAR